jgi:pimeloyl-ACP methyl ester carboxylesterase
MTSPQLSVPVEHRFADINGIRMHYVEAGSGSETLVFLHGFPEFWYSWRHQIEAFAPEFRVVAPDLRGYNETENAGPYDTGTLQEDVAALIRHLGEEKVHLVGHDWGGAVGWLLAINRPEILRSYVACNIPHPAMFQRGIRNPRQLLRSWYVFFFQLPWLPEKFLARQRYQQLAKLLIDDTRPGTFTREDIKAYLEAWRRQGLAGGVNWYRAALRQSQPLPDPPVVTVPTTLIWGEDDRALGKELTFGTEEFVPDLTVHYLPDTSHWVQQERPTEVNQFIREHLERVRQA